MSEKHGPSRWWYAVAAAVFVFGLVPLGVMVTNAVTGLLGYELHDFRRPAAEKIELDGDQVAIFTTYDGPGVIRCMASGPDVQLPPGPHEDVTAVMEPLDRPWWSLEISNGSEQWHRVAVTPQDWDGGTYQIVCAPESAAGEPSPSFAYAENPALLGTALGFLITLGIAAVAALTALIIAAVVFAKRSKANRPPLPSTPQFPPGPPAAY